MAPFDQELDLRPYIQTLTTNWKMIAGLTIFFSILTFLFTFTRPREYEATANLLVTRSRATLSLAEQFPTVNEPVNSRSRMDAILTISSSNAITAIVLESVSDRIDPENRVLEDFRRKVTIESTGDALLITARAEEPQLARDIANAWAIQAAQFINLAYSGEQPLFEIQRQIAEARTSYETSQQNLEAFIIDSGLVSLEEQVKESIKTFTTLSEERARELQLLHDRKLALTGTIYQINALIGQINSGAISDPGDIGDALAVVLARSYALAATNPQTTLGGGQGNITLDLPLNTLDELRDTQDAYAADLEILAATLSAALAETETAIQGLANAIVSDGDDELIERTASMIQELNAAIELEKSKELELRSERDLNWSAYQALAEKEVEIQNTTRTDDVVTLASIAVAPQKPKSRGTVFNTLIAAGLGLFIGVFFAFLRNWFQSLDLSSS